MQIDESDEQCENAILPSRATLQPVSNLTLESVVHRLKQRFGISATDDGMQIDESNEHDENAHASIRER
jgi:hypothetical protein